MKRILSEGRLNFTVSIGSDTSVNSKRESIFTSNRHAFIWSILMALCSLIEATFTA